MTFVQLKYILTIAETKSLNKAAEQLYVSQPSLTNALKELEKEVGITILPGNFTGSMNSCYSVMERAVLIKRNLRYPPSTTLLR